MRHTESTATASVALNMLHIKPRNNSSGVRARRKLWRGVPTSECGAARSPRHTVDPQCQEADRSECDPYQAGHS